MAGFRRTVLVVIVLFLSLVSAQAAEPVGVRLTVLYDNWVAEQGTEADWGFAMLVQRGDATILFDTGTKDWVLRHNLRRLNVDLTTVDAVVLSHDHGDHTGGLFSVLDATEEVPVYAPTSFTEVFAREVRREGSKVVINAEPQKISKGIFTSGTVDGDIPEQALVIETESGLLVITGCAHPGVVEMVRQVKLRFEAEVHTVLGGFHLLRHDADGVTEVMKQLEALGVRSAGPSHCSGKSATDAFRQAFGDRFVALGTGRVVTFD